MLNGYDDSGFAEALSRYFTPAQPVSKADHLFGRDTKLRLIKRAIDSPGKHVFIFGDRGVGKTSLAKTAAQIHLDLMSELPIVACQAETQSEELVEAICREIHKTKRLQTEGQIDLTKSIETPPLIAPPAIRNINDAILTIKSETSELSKPTVVIIDEFDQISDDKVKKFVADLIKQLSDQEIKLRLFICGIGKSLEELIGVHLSTDRYLSTIELEKIPHDARWKILQSALSHFGIEFDRNSIVRIGQISDGYPYYIHLIGEKIFWEIFDDDRLVTKISSDHYDRGIKAAIEESQTSLKQAYDMATQKHGNSEDYEEVLWAVADGKLLVRQVSDIYDQSYVPIMEQRSERKRLSKEQFYQRMNKLKQDSHGNVLNGSKQGWYSFNENVVRGYVRLRAERAGIKIGLDHPVPERFT
ncbi:ATP-binding protein [Novosphingobium resinovorum]|uniref:AAA family ATPase n=1 Tax=Novosphingobium TaxID=165696 RepID=UPI001B3CA3E3|nr:MULTISPECIES: ATP-binding protein [Novosphingobium]MBF7012297.1 ATP-binding protein [Novosphingobium sp. HR1a]WJM27039.1 ATP-binding protein [Novosphingobium resinovorum]